MFCKWFFFCQEIRAGWKWKWTKACLSVMPAGWCSVRPIDHEEAREGGGAVSIVYKELSSASACILATVRSEWTGVKKCETTLWILILQWKHCLSVSSRWTILWVCDYLTNLSLSRSGSMIVDGCNAVKQPTAGRECKWVWRWHFVIVGYTCFLMWVWNSRPHSKGSRMDRFSHVMDVFYSNASFTVCHISAMVLMYCTQNSVVAIIIIFRLITSYFLSVSLFMT